MLKPKKGESKQDFLKRCRAQGSMSDCAESWNSARLSSFVDENSVHLSGEVEFLKKEGESETDLRRFSMLGYAGSVIDFGWMGKFVIDLVGLTPEKEKMPALHIHSSREIAGTIDTAESSSSGFVAEGTFSQVTEWGPYVCGLADEGFPWQCSIGVRATKILSIKEGETHKVNGQTVVGPIDVWLEAKVFEVSFCPFGADDETAAVAMSADHEPQTEILMNAKKKAWLMTLGLNANANDVEAKAFLAKIEAAGVITIPDFTAEPEKPAANLGASQPVQPVQPPAVVSDAPVVATLSATDTLTLSQNAITLGFSLADFTDGIKAGLDLPTLNTQLLEKAALKNPPLAHGRIDTGADETDKFRGAVSAGLAMRMGYESGKDEKPAPGFEEFRHMSMSDIGGRCLSRAGVNVSGFSKSQIATEILRLSAGSSSTSDFKSIFMDSTHKRLLKAYRDVPQRFRPIVNVVELSDFREVYGVALSGASDFKEVKENGEYKELSLKDNQESFRPGKFGGIISLTYEMIVNDDMRAFAKIPKILGAASARTLNNFVWNLFLSNPVMADGKTLFHADHNNISTPASKLDSVSLGKARAAMSKQVGLNKEMLDIEPAFLVVPTELETSAEILLRSTSLPDANMSAGVHNPHAGKLIPIAEPRLDAKSPTAWYLVGNPSQVETIDLGFLDGRQEPEIFEDEKFSTDAISYKARICFGAGVMDHVGFRRNLGV
ncbi:hypothetical protein [Maridesulfovibrio ferrireducens]|uniref:phage major capsid protein n=1 Tax=Maridesulfovibrio ferrireducens TaxID=246191 RepID=UPI001A353784|nr:hypothetical protein [Maridesulfovibrio ferrireducens]MBI9109994.1 hypothetical protein [Maridesulfovibrio ferrireducens]